MGGTITVIVREKKDKIHKMHRWTNSFPFYIKSLKFIEKDPSHLKKYMHQWVLMKKDYEKNKETGDFKYQMTSVYVPDSGDISPCGYGILFIDLVENKIISSQGYSSVSEIDITEISNWINQSKYDKESLKILKDYEELHKAKKLELVSYDGKPVDKKIKEQLESDDFLNNIEKLFKDKNAYKKIFGLSFKVDLSPFEVFEFGDDDKGLKQAYVEIKKLVKLTAKEEKMWKSEIKERKY